MTEYKHIRPEVQATLNSNTYWIWVKVKGQGHHAKNDGIDEGGFTRYAYVKYENPMSHGS